MSDAESSDPTLPEIIRRKIEAAVAKMRVMLPGQVVSYDDDRRSAEVQPMVDDIYLGENDKRSTAPLPVLHDVPVVMLGSGTTRVKFPIAKGDPCMLVFASSSIARWKLTGKGGDPGDPRRHHHNDAVMIPGLSALGAEDDAILIEFTATELILGGTGAVPTIKATQYRAAEDTLLTALGVYATALGTAMGPLAPAAVTLNTAITAFKSAAATYLTQIAKVK